MVSSITSPLAPHILVVDDEPDIQILFEQKFRREIREGKLRFSFAESGHAAIGLLESIEDIEIVFTDLNMPGMDGLELLARLRAMNKDLIRAVVISAYGDMANIRTAMNQGAMDFIVKPIDLQDLGLTLKKAWHEVEETRKALISRMDIDRLRVEVASAERIRKLQMEFFDNVTHELRTPLTLILGPLEMAIDKVQKVDVRDHLLLAHRNGLRILQLMEELLDTSRIEAGAMEFNALHGEINEFLRSAFMAFEPLARSKDIEFRLTLPEIPLAVRYDPAKLQKVFSNLISNALKYTAHGGSVEVRLGLAGGQVQVLVEDNGPGISKEDQPRIFDRFFRADQQQAGSGIGLAMALSLVKLHGGDLRVYSEPGQGARFEVLLPLAQALEVGETRHSPMVENEEEGGPLLLLVEDDPDMRAYVKASLGVGYRIMEAQDGVAGLALAREQVPDIIVTDWTMPVMDGLALCKALRADVACSHVPIVMLTAKASQGNKLDGLREGADAYLYKPFSADELRLVLQNLLRRQADLRARLRLETLTSPIVKEQMSMDEQFLEKVQSVLQMELANERFGVEQLADALVMSRKTLHRKLSALTGQAPNPFIRAFRLEAAMKMLKQKTGPVGEIAFMTGFGSHSYFSKCFQEYFNVSPSEVEVAT